MPTATANGKTFNFPDGVTPEQMGQAIDEYFSGQPQQAAPSQDARQSTAVDFSQGNAEIEKQKQKAQQDARKQQFDQLAEDTNPLQQLAIGAGRAIVATGQGIKQAAMKGGEAIGLVSPETNKAYQSQLTEEEQNYRELANRKPLASVGEFGGAVALAAPAFLIPGGQGVAANMAIGAGVGATGAALQPVTGEDSFAEGKAKQLAIGGLIGGAIPGAVSLIKGEPAKKALQTIVNKAQNTERGLRGVELNQKFGDVLTPGQESGSKLLTGFENMARQSLFTADQVLEHDKMVANKAIQVIDDFTKKLGKEKSSEILGIDIQNGIKNAVSQLVEARKLTAAKNYGLVREIAGKKPVIEFKNVRDELKKIISEGEQVSGSNADLRKVASQAKAILSDLSGKEVPASLIVDKAGAPVRAASKNTLMDIDKALANRSAWSAASAGKGNIFQDISPSLDRVMGARLSKAASLDFDLSGDAIGNPQLQAALKNANENFALYSKSISGIQESALGKLLGKDMAEGLLNDGFNTIPGEKVVSKLARMTPSEISASMRVLEDANPGLIGDIKSYVIKAALEAGQEVPPSTAAQGYNFSYNKFLKALPDDRKMKALGFSEKESKEIKDITDFLLRTNDRTGYNASGTDVRNEARNLLGVVFGGKIVSSTIGTAGQVAGMKKIANAMTSREGRQALLTLSKPSASRSAIERASAFLTGEESGQGL